MRITISRWAAATAVCLVSFILSATVLAQEFQNLDFEASVIQTSDPFIFAKVPGWSFSGEELFEGPHDTLFFGIHIGDVPLQRMATDLVTEPPLLVGPLPIQGHFSVHMGPAPHQDYAPNFPWMQQTGRVPSGARSIRMAGQLDPLNLGDPSRRGWHLTLGGTEIPLIALPNGVLSGDVTALAGTTAPLRITIDQSYYRDLGFGGKQRTNFLFDAIRFSPLEYTEVPEPTSSLLAMIGLATHALSSRRRRSAELA